ncbi:aspartyl/glutamyl-tRNA(Asn/Gln) amidotransferase subunit A [Ruminococcaceae bacterium YRB3002]|nr:aspartyl/glutamyl-tRNA(Asn/Gln) amidotransferase subunit A [Ruminococcaceae bacterium YRB3002]
MTKEEILRTGALELGRLIKEGKVTSEEATTAYIEAIKAEDTKFNSYITICDDAVDKAREADKKIVSGELTGPLAGVPVAVKDNICTKDLLTSCGSKMLSNFIPPYDATVVRKIREEGMVIIGKTNMDEFAMGSTTETSYYGPTVNPHGTGRVPGGSSGGSAACVAAGLAPFSLGSDTGGSIRQPASFCGVTGLKPTYGTVSRYGLVAFASSLDQIGPIGRSALDCAALFNVISGVDEHDQSSTVSDKVDMDKIASFDVKGKKIGIPAEYMGEGIDEDVRNRVMEAVRFYEEQGASVETFEMPIIEYAIPTYYIIACAEACSNLSRYDGVKYGYRPEGVDNLIDLYIKSRSEGFGMEVKRRIMLGNFVLSSGYYDAYYNKALQAKALIKKAFDEAFEKYDVVIGPVAPTTALKAGESLSDPLKMYLGDICTVLINIVGLPAISVPCGSDKEGMPVGMQIIGKHYDEETILGFAASYQKAHLTSEGE